MPTNVCKAQKAFVELLEDSPACLYEVSNDGYAKYVTDESRRVGAAAYVALPREVNELSAVMAWAKWYDVLITVSGARTGITGGAVPEGGWVVSLERLNGIRLVRRLLDGAVAVTCGAGVLLQELFEALRIGRFPDLEVDGDATQAFIQEIIDIPLFFPPDPTEISASIGGAVACNASGAHTFRYGPVREYVNWLRVVLADGSVLEVERGDCVADENGCFVFEDQDGCRHCFNAPSYQQPKTKNASGYFSGPHLDLVDLFVGSEGTLGVVAEVELRLVRRSEVHHSLVIFLDDEARALALTGALREKRDKLGLEAIEYFDAYALDFMRHHRKMYGASSGVPACLDDGMSTALYLDLGVAAGQLAASLTDIADMLPAFGASAALCWSAASSRERERLRLFRHALPEAVNQHVAELKKQTPGITKLGTDMAVPDEALAYMMGFYRQELEKLGLDYVIFGHIGDNHLHVNILPRSEKEYALGKQLYKTFAAEAIRLGGSPAAEHGIGKLKVYFLRELVGDDGIRQMKNIKAVFDPYFRLGKGTLFECE